MDKLPKPLLILETASVSQFIETAFKKIINFFQGNITVKPGA